MNPKYQHCSAEELELKASYFLSQFDDWCFDGSQTLIEEILDEQGYDIWPVPGLAPFLEGFVPIVGKRIFVDEFLMTLDLHAYRFTLAEEQAHEILHRPFFRGWRTEEIMTFRDSLTSEEYLMFEREARYLAACLLMPRQAFVQRVQTLCGLIISLRSDRYKESERLYKMLSEEFNVDPYAVVWRCEQLGLVQVDKAYGIA